MSNNVEQLIERLNIILDVEGGEPSVSPTSKSSGKASALSDGLYIRTDMDVESLSSDDLMLAHVLLHKFYATGHKELTSADMERLHDEVKARMNHTMFDRLDRR